MGIYIKGMEMPKKCSQCNFCKDFECLALKRTFNLISKGDCPLIEVPTPHGDLIDRIALLNHMTNVHKEWQEHPDQHKSIITIVDDELMVCGFPAIIKEEGT